MRKKDRLYTVNKWNRPAFMPSANMFDIGGVKISDLSNTGGGYNFSGYTTDFSVGKGLDSNTMSKVNSAGAQGVSGGAGKGMGNAAWVQAIPGALNGWTAALQDKPEYSSDAHNGFSLVDSTLAQNKRNKVGMGLVNSGASLMNKGLESGNGYMALAGGIAGTLGTIINAGWGTKENTENIDKVNNNISTAGNVTRAMGRSATNEDLLGISSHMITDSGFSAGDLYEDGWFTSEGTRKGKELLTKERRALTAQNQNFVNAADRIDKAYDNAIMRSSYAFGGPLTDNNMGAIDYGFMSDYMTLKKQQAETKNKIAGISPMPVTNTFSDGGGIHIKHPGRLTALKERTGKTEAELYNDGNPAHKKMVVFARNARKWKHADGGPLNTLYQEEIPLFAFGGDLQTNVSDFSTGLVHIDAGGSHSENPYDGVQLGVDPQGVPNLVEENETVWNDYVFSNRIEADEETRKKFHLPKKAKLTYADISKKLEKEISERPNDPISEAGFKAQMQDLADQQERQKQEMEAARAREAFEALSPEEQTAIMQQKAMEEQAMMNQVAQEQAIAEQQAMQQPSPEEAAMMQADGSQAMIGEEPQMQACGGKINKFEKGGTKKTQKNVGTWKNDKENHWDVFTKPGLKRYLENLKQKLAMAPNDEVKEEIRKEAMNELNSLQQSYFSHVLPSAGADKYEYSEDILNHQKMFDRLYGNTGFYTTDENGNVRNLIAEAINLPNGAATEDKPENWADGYNGRRTSIRNFGSTEYGDSKYYQDLVDEFANLGLTYAPNENWKYGDNQLYGLSLPESETVKEEKPKVWDWQTRGWIDKPSTAAATTTVKPSVTQEDEEEETASPKHRPEWMRYAGLLGPAAGLGLMAAGVGKPDYSSLDAAVASSGDVALADYKPIGDYLRYRPLDIWYAQNRMDANARATDRALMDSGVNQGSKMAGLLANGYNSQMGSGELFRQAQEYNDALRERAATFNRGTNQFNSEAYNRTSQFNAAARNQANQTRSQIALQAAREKLEGDAGWYNSLYGNIGSLFKGISDLGRENAQWNIIADSAADGVFGNLGTSYTGQRVLDTKKTKRSKGGNIKKKKGLTY